MNLTRHNPEIEFFRDGSQRGDVTYFRLQWWNASEGHRREDYHHSAVFAHPDNPNLFLTPYADAYFKGVLPTDMPNNSKVDKIVVATDVDAKFWEYEFYGPPSSAFKAITDPMYDPDRHNESLWSISMLGKHLNHAFERNMRHMPRALFFIEEFSTALVVLSALQSATYHLKEMAGVACLPETDFDEGEMHDAMMRHEWFHLSEDGHLNDLEIENGADDEAVKGIETPELKQAWIDARIVGGFMWPFVGRQNGIPLIDDNFRKRVKQEIQMNAVYEWCDHVFSEFYNSTVAAEIISGLYGEIDKGNSLLPEDLEAYFVERFWNKGMNDRKAITSAEDFKSWLLDGEDQAVSQQAWRYFTQSYMMALQVSNANRPEFYAQMCDLSDRLYPSNEGAPQSTKQKVHEYFRSSLKRLLPDMPNPQSDFEPAWASVQLPSVQYRMGPYVG